MPCRTIRPVAFRLLLGFAALPIVLLVALPAFAGKVYQWKDASGVTHYSDALPPGQQGVRDRQLKDGPAAPQAAKAEDPSCATARRNLVQLKSEGPVGLDANGDGKPDKEMTADERAEQVRQAESVVRTCDKPAAAP